MSAAKNAAHLTELRDRAEQTVERLHERADWEDAHEEGSRPDADFDRAVAAQITMLLAALTSLARPEGAPIVALLGEGEQSAPSTGRGWSEMRALASETAEWGADFQDGMFTPARTPDGWSVEMHQLVKDAVRLAGDVLALAGGEES